MATPLEGYLGNVNKCDNPAKDVHLLRAFLSDFLWLIVSVVIIQKRNTHLWRSDPSTRNLSWLRAQFHKRQAPLDGTTFGEQNQCASIVRFESLTWFKRLTHIYLWVTNVLKNFADFTLKRVKSCFEYSSMFNSGSGVNIFGIHLLVSFLIPKVFVQTIYTES